MTPSRARALIGCSRRTSSITLHRQESALNTPVNLSAARSTPRLSNQDLLRLADQCVKCGLCLPHCPTYAKTRHEGDSPRGRIALVQGWLTGQLDMTPGLAAHLDGCLLCRACESACPSLVAYGRLLDGARTQRVAADSGLAAILDRTPARRPVERSGHGRAGTVGLCLCRSRTGAARRDRPPDPFPLDRDPSSSSRSAGRHGTPGRGTPDRRRRPGSLRRLLGRERARRGDRGHSHPLRTARTPGPDRVGRGLLRRHAASQWLPGGRRSCPRAVRARPRRSPPGRRLQRLYRRTARASGTHPGAGGLRLPRPPNLARSSS
jgi:ferredoxin